MLHLLGYDDQSPADAERMRAAEQHYLRCAVKRRRERRLVEPASILLCLAIGSCVASALAAIAARALREFSRHNLQEICERRQKLDRFGEIVRDHDRVALGLEVFVVLATTLAVAAGSYWAWTETAHGGPHLGGRSLTIGRRRDRNPVARPTSPYPGRSPASASSRSSISPGPLAAAERALVAAHVGLARGIDALLTSRGRPQAREPDEEAFEDEIRTIVTEGHREGLLEEDAREMIESVIDLGDVIVSHIMTPRTDMQMIQC